MPNFIDETGNKYGRLLVLYRATEIGKPVKWHCICDCGVEIDVLGASLRSGNTQSCGCLKKEKIIESNIKRNLTVNIGQKYNYLTVLEKPFIKNNQKIVKCQCICGKITYPRVSRLLSGETRSCGCVSNKLHRINEIDNRYGKLVVIEEAGSDENGRALWKCLCDCGNIKITLGKSLRQGLVNSCGCLSSKGEQKIQHILQENKIKFIREYTFNNLRSKNNCLLYFDFFLPDFNTCIEYQGEQHYKDILHHWKNFSFEKTQEHDQLKRNYCQQNNIKLIEIPYTDYEKISIDYIKKKVGDINESRCS